MTGLDKIISKINADSETKNNAMIAQAQSQCDSIIDQAKRNGEKLAAEIQSQAEKQCNTIIAMSESGSAQKTRQTVLAAKVEVINQTLEKLHKTLCSMPEDEYFEAIVKLAGENCMSGSCEARLNSADNARKPDWFNKRLVDALAQKDVNCVVSDVNANIESGIILVYGDIEINCSFKALIEADADNIKAKIGDIIF